MLNYLRKIISPDNFLRLLWHRLKSMVAAIKYGFPAKKMTIIGVTGTNGKTTTTHMIEHILRQSDKKVAMISTVEFRLLGKATPNTSKKTTLSPFKTQAFLKKCLQKGVEYVVIEASSHALHQSRLWGIPFSIAVLTNITHEHLDYHRTMEKYRDAKMLLFKKAHTSILNTASRFYPDFMQLKCPQKISYGLNQGDVRAVDSTFSKFGSKFGLEYSDEVLGVELKIPGTYNIENALAASGAAFAVKCSLEQIKNALQTFPGVPGRMEVIRSPKGFEVIVDFGLTPDALEKLYSFIKANATGRIFGIIGATGDRDREKRPILGRIVSSYTDVTIVTDEEPYSEDPRVIMEAVLEGAKENKTLGKDLKLVEDRYAAIELAVKNAQPGDTIVVTGMGNFTTRNLNQGPIPWDERAVVREIIKKYA